MGANLPDIASLMQAGIDPKTRLPLKMAQSMKCMLKENLRRAFRILDEQNAVNRYVWFNLPNGLNGNLMERILYYKAQGMFFYMPTDETFYFLPYALDGTIDVYGHFKGVTPLPFNGTAQDKKDAWITGLTRTPIYDLLDVDMVDNPFENACVLLSDYTKQISQTNIPRAVLQEPLIDVLAECIPLGRTAMINNTGTRGMRVPDQDAYTSVEQANNQLLNSALEGKPLIPTISNIEFQDLGVGSGSTADEFLQFMQGVDNVRLSLLGLQNGGMYEKDSAYVNETTASSIQANVGQIYQDGLSLRQRFCDMVNAIWGLGIYVEPSETVLNTDYDGDGDIDDDFNQDGIPGDQKESDVNEEL